MFVSFGLGDVGGVCAEAVATIRQVLPSAHLDIVLGSSAHSLAALKTLMARESSVHLHVDATNIASLMLDADIGVGAGGGGTWERCCLGLPSVAVVLADNQRAVIEALELNGVLSGVEFAGPGWQAKLQQAIERLAPPTAREAFRAASMAACDGRGAQRVAQTLLARLG